jgi:FeS assembly SUF system protein
MKQGDSHLREFMAGGQPEAGSVAYAGSPLPEGRCIASMEAVIDALRTVYDPEIPLNIYDLGLIYRLDVAEDGSVSIDMTLTAPGCPVAGAMPGAVADAVAAVDGVGEVEVTLVWEPPWSQDRMTCIRLDQI